MSLSEPLGLLTNTQETEEQRESHHEDDVS